jgi:hypothetical protein
VRSLGGLKFRARKEIVGTDGASGDLDDGLQVFPFRASHPTAPPRDGGPVAPDQLGKLPVGDGLGRKVLVQGHAA